MIVDWREAANPAGAYQSRSYGEAACLSTDSTWQVIGDDDGNWRLPLCVAEIEDDLIDVTSPYGYPGIFASSKLSEFQIDQAWQQTRKALAKRNVVSALVRFAPYRESLEGWHHNLEGLDTVYLSDTIGIPLSDDSAMWAGMHGRSRTAVRRARQEGMTVSIAPADESLVSPDSDFRRLYDLSMERVGASVQHRHSDPYYETLLGGMDFGVYVVSVFNAQGTVVASCLLLSDSDGMHYHLSGSQVEYARLGANNLMIWTALTWAAENGHTLFHLGGGTRKADSLYRFKASFGGTALPYFVGRLVLRPDVYSRLVRERAQSIGQTVSALEVTGYFPTYRAGGIAV